MVIFREIRFGEVICVPGEFRYSILEYLYVNAEFRS